MDATAANKAQRRAAEKTRRPGALAGRRPAARLRGREAAQEASRPGQIANRLRLVHPDEPHWCVFHETIYQALYL
jgi:hypothetical protein